MSPNTKLESMQCSGLLADVATG